MEVTNSLSSNSNNVYPLCYKIKETSYQSSCINKLAKYVKLKKKIYGNNPTATEQAHQNFVQCLKQYGDIYKKLGIELYVNSNTNKITFPDNQRIQSNLNEYMRKIADDETINSETSSAKTQDDNIMLYNVLLNDSLRNAYNDFYVSDEFAKNGQPLAKFQTVDEIPTSASKSIPSVSKSSNPFASKTTNPFSRKATAQQKQPEYGNGNIITPDSSVGGKIRRTRKSKKRRKSKKHRKTRKRGK
jgi:hypothetical protein